MHLDSSPRPLRVLFLAACVAAWALAGLSILDPAPLLAPSHAQDKAAAPLAPGKYLGASACDGAQCHGKPEARPEPPYLTEYVSWSAMNGDVPYDRHSYAWKRLRGSAQGGDDRSPEMMDKLNALEGTKDKAEQSERCLTCHGVAVHDYGVGKKNPGAAVAKHKPLQGARYKNEEGVSCDGCHGPAEKWLKAHDKPGWAEKKWEELGGKSGGSQKLYDQFGIYYSKDLELWADECVRCHLRIDTNLLEAGHPDLLAFELFGHNQQVPHWRPYAFSEGKATLPAAGKSHPASTWAVGQAVCVRSAIEQLGERAAGAHHNKATPEYLAAAQRRLASHWIALRSGLKTLSPAAVEPLEQAIAPLVAEGAEAAALAEGCKKALELAKPLARTLSDAAIDKAQVVAILKALAADEAGYADATRAELLMKSMYTLAYARLMYVNPDTLFAETPDDALMQAVFKMFESTDPASESFKQGLAKAREALAKE